MVRSQLTLFAACVLCLSAAADDRPKPAPKAEDKAKAKAAADDPIAAALETAKEDYQSAVEKAGEKLVADFTDRQKKLEDDTKLKVDQVIKMVEQVQEEKKAFELDPAKLPKSAGMYVAASDYQIKTAAARKKCEAAFDKAAEAYRGKRDLVIAKAVLAEKKQFFAAPAVDSRTVWVHSGGSFIRHKDGTWLESKTNGQRYNFNEAARTKAYVEMKNANCSVRLFADRSEIRRGEAEYKNLYFGSWDRRIAGLALVSPGQAEGVFGAIWTVEFEDGSLPLRLQCTKGHKVFGIAGKELGTWEQEGAVAVIKTTLGGYRNGTYQITQLGMKPPTYRGKYTNVKGESVLINVTMLKD